MRHILIILIILLSYSGLRSGEITINDTLARRGEIINIPVYYTHDDSLDSGLKMIFNFNAQMLNIDSVFGDENSIYKGEITFNSNIDQSDYDNSTLEVGTPQDIPESEGVLFYLKTEILAGPDSLAKITPVAIEYIDTVVSGFTFNGGIVTIPDPVRETSETVLGNFRPNPFNGASKSYLYLNLETDIKISAYNISGQKSISLICSEDCTDNFFQITDKNGNLVPDEDKLDPGEYFIHIKNSNMLSAGAYLVVLSTDFEVITRKFIIIK